MTKPLDTKVQILYNGHYVCTTHTRKQKRTAKACLQRFLEAGRLEGVHSYYGIEKKNAGASFDEKKFKAYYDK